MQPENLKVCAPNNGLTKSSHLPALGQIFDMFQMLIGLEVVLKFTFVPATLT